MTESKKEKIQNILRSLPDTKLEGLKTLFWEELNYEHENKPLSVSAWSAEYKAHFVTPPVLFASAGLESAFHIIYCHLTIDRMMISVERAVINELIKTHPHSLFIFSNHPQTHWHFVNSIYEKDEKAQRRRILRRISVSSEDRLRTASERISCLDTLLAGHDHFGIDPHKLQKLHEEAFNVEAVTDEFFNEYKKIYNLLKEYLFLQTKDPVWAHDFALQFMNRLMFLYYVERKRWLGNDPDFLHNFWRAYKTSPSPTDTFQKDWLNILFFEAFNKKFSSGRPDISYIPQQFRNALQLVPWLNGGLFAENDLDKRYPYEINDKILSKIFDFLDRFNFTISEDTPLDQEVAVDPEMIGKVYESLVNISTEADDQSDAGIFYTPRIEIDLMCRLSLVDWLSNHLTDISKNLLYEFVFAFSSDDKHSADAELTRLNLWPDVDKLLRDVTVLDPACGSGSFLVGMLMILDDLLTRSGDALGRQVSPFDRRKHIIGSSLYGVDIMEWAVHVAELRLWLQLVIDTDIDENELRLRPLLPNLSFKLRHGDSLVQEIGGINLGLRRSGGQIRRELAGKLNTLKAEKIKYFNNEENRQFKTKEQIEQAEHQLFREIIMDELRSTRSRQVELTQALAPSTNLFGEVQNPQLKLDLLNKRHDLEQVEQSINKLKSASEMLLNQKDLPFVWDVAFVEIFEGDAEGFDIVIGNPPYVRQERIHDPSLSQDELSDSNKKEYKEKLSQMIYSTYPLSFGYKPGENKVNKSIDKKSDYYIYFYYICLSLLNARGSFCFITSNSWLDVGYGANLQWFLLTRCHIKLIIDNQAKRSFRNAEVNTIITLLSSPIDSMIDNKVCLEHSARFVMFKMPFEIGLSSILWEEVNDAIKRSATVETHIVVITQEELLETGWDTQNGLFLGDKWGGKYLRAPDLYWKIFDKNILTSIEPRVGNVCTVTWSRLGLNLDLFSKKFVPDAIPVIKSPRDSSKIIFSLSDSKYYLLYKLINSNQLIRCPILWDDIHGYKHICRLNKDLLPFTHNFHGITLLNNINTDVFCAILNSTLIWFLIEILGRKSLGGGAIRLLVTDLKRLKIIIDPDTLDNGSKNKLVEAFNKLSKRDVLKVNEEIQLDSNGKVIVKDDRKALDEVIFDFIELSLEDRIELYKLTLQYTNMRSNKSKKT